MICPICVDKGNTVVSQIIIRDDNVDWTNPMAACNDRINQHWWHICLGVAKLFGKASCLDPLLNGLHFIAHFVPRLATCNNKLRILG